MFWIVFTVITVVVAIGFIIKNLPFIYELKDVSDKPFICPNCSKTFYIKWYRLAFFKMPNFYMHRAVKFKCPHCKISDMCSYSRD